MNETISQSINKMNTTYEKEYIEKVASPFTAAACGAVDDIFAPADTRAKVISALDILAGKRENTLPRKHSVK